MQAAHATYAQCCSFEWIILMSYLEEPTHSLPPHHQGTSPFLYRWVRFAHLIILFAYLLTCFSEEYCLINQNALDL